jgi:hypothetical protein
MKKPLPKTLSIKLRELQLVAVTPWCFYFAGLSNYLASGKLKLALKKSRKTFDACLSDYLIDSKPAGRDLP